MNIFVVEEHLTTKAHYMFVAFNLDSGFEVVNLRDRNNYWTKICKNGY